MIADFLGKIYEASKTFVPPGIEPVYFYGTFFIVFAVIFSVLERIEFFGKEKRGARAIIGLVIAYLTASSAFSATMISKIFPNLGILVVAILGLLILLYLLGAGALITGKFVGIFILIAMGIILWISWSQTAGELGYETALPIATDEWAIIALIAGFFIILIWITGRGKE